MAQITCDNISIGYEKKAVLDSLHFSINKGEYLCVVGENGAGKSTLIKTILGLIPLISGEIVFGDGLNRKEIGYLPQQTIIQKDFPATVLEVVMSGFQNRSVWRPFYTNEEKKKAKENLKKLGIENLEKSCYRELSGGQQQRVLLARALCGTQKMLLLDEPVAGLDPIAMKEMYNIIKQINDEGITVIMISHDIYSAKKYASHILFLSNKWFYGTKEEFEHTSFGEQYDHFLGGCAHDAE